MAVRDLLPKIGERGNLTATAWELEGYYENLGINPAKLSAAFDNRTQLSVLMITSHARLWGLSLVSVGTRPQFLESCSLFLV